MNPRTIFITETKPAFVEIFSSLGIGMEDMPFFVDKIFEKSKFLVTATETDDIFHVKMQFIIQHPSPLRKSSRNPVSLMLWVFCHHLRSINIEGWQSQINYKIRNASFVMTKEADVDGPSIWDYVKASKEALLKRIVGEIKETLSFLPSFSEIALGFTTFYSQHFEQRLKKLEKKLPKITLKTIKAILTKIKQEKYIKMIEEEFYKIWGNQMKQEIYDDEEEDEDEDKWKLI